MPLANIPMVLKFGILSHEEAAKLPHDSVALSEIQERRDIKRVPGGLKLHQYANLYFSARNPMLFRRKNDAATLCVLRVENMYLHCQTLYFSTRMLPVTMFAFSNRPKACGS
jgi:hypothetical protein